MDYLLSGSLAYDTILLHQGEFHQKILPDEIARLNVAFGIDDIRMEYGGTGGNIAYNSSLLNLSPMLITSVGCKNCDDYVSHLKSNNIDTGYLNYVIKESVASAWIMTDINNNQITGFNSGAMKHTPKIPTLTPNLWHLAPDSALTTLHFAKQATTQNKKYFLDPGQALFSLANQTEETEQVFSFKQAIENSTGLFVNDYEALILLEQTDSTLEQLLNNSKLEFIVVTKGSKGGTLYQKDKQFDFPVANPKQIVDPTGCGDAFRAGFISQYINKQSLEDCVYMGSVMGSFAIETSGGQSHKPYFEEIYERFHELKTLV